MVLTAKQEEGLKIALERWHNGEKYTVISGYAGTGKSTLIKFIISAMGLYDTQVRYVAYTGKAANVLKNKNCPGATTAHKLLYHARLMPNGKYHFMPKRRADMDPEIKVVVVDEVSMLPKDMWDLLCRHSFYILACGDPEQLPPIPEHPGDDPNNHVLDNPHVFLDEVMRQAQESEIIRLSMHVREGNPLNTFPVKNEEVMIFRKSELTDSMLQWADQVLCATKRNRQVLNNRMRNIYGFSGDPQIGDKVINLHNEWEFLSSHNNPLTNGVIGTITYMNKEHWEYPNYIKGIRDGKNFTVPILQLTMTGDEEGEEFVGAPADFNELVTGQATLSGNEEYKILQHKVGLPPVPMHFNYGYAITVWKAQGSEWGKVLLCQEPGWPRDPDTCRKYLYTGITRAVNRLVIIQG